MPVLKRECVPAARPEAWQAPSLGGRRGSLWGDGHADLSQYTGSLHTSAREGVSKSVRKKKWMNKKKRRNHAPEKAATFSTTVAGYKLNITVTYTAV